MRAEVPLTSVPCLVSWSFSCYYAKHWVIYKEESLIQVTVWWRPPCRIVMGWRVKGVTGQDTASCHWLSLLLFFLIKNLSFCTYVHAGVYVCGGTHVPQYTCKSHWTTLWTWFCHSKFIWILQIALTLLGFVANVFDFWAISLSSPPLMKPIIVLGGPHFSDLIKNLNYLP